MYAKGICSILFTDHGTEPEHRIKSLCVSLHPPPNFLDQNSIIDPSDIKIHKEKFLHELEIYQLRVEEKKAWQNKRISRSYVEFWMECAKFYVTAMESWALCGDSEKYDEAVHNAQA